VAFESAQILIVVQRQVSDRVVSSFNNNNKIKTQNATARATDDHTLNPHLCRECTTGGA
jgi:hypothetical protein